jgi:cation diffusion facilitator CzcD-associated flavoprotein CzcO
MFFSVMSLLPSSKVLIIGAGPAGLVSYRNLTVHGKFDNVTVYERRDDVGGVWCVSDLLQGFVLMPSQVPR